MTKSERVAYAKAHFLRYKDRVAAGESEDQAFTELVACLTDVYTLDEVRTALARRARGEA